MPEKPGSNIHEWVNTIGVVIALLISLASVLISWQGFVIKQDTLYGYAESTLDCQFVLRVVESSPTRELYDQGIRDRFNQLSMCWKVTIINAGEDLTTITDFPDLVNLADNDISSNIPRLNSAEDNNGSELKLPFILAPGESKSFLVRFPMTIPDKVADLVANMIPHFIQHAVAPFKLSLAESILCKNHLDFLGNESAPLFSQGCMPMIGAGHKVNTMNERLHLCTSRDIWLELPLSYPFEGSRTILRRSIMGNPLARGDIIDAIIQWYQFKGK